MRTFPSLEAFYRDDARRRESRERDVGLFWRASRGASFRAAWIRDTGEVYLFRHGVATDGGGTVSLLGRRFTLETLKTALAGYRDICGRRGSLAWFLDRVGGAAPLRAAA